MLTRKQIWTDQNHSAVVFFFPDPKEANSSNPEWVPVGTLLVFNGSWTAPECPNPGDDGASRFSDFCDSIMKPFSDRLFLSDPSLVKKYADKGNSIGDDVCWVLKNKVTAPYVGPKKPSKKIPKRSRVCDVHQQLWQA